MREHEFLNGMGGGSAYGVLVLLGVVVSLVFWTRLARKDSRMVLIYFGALGGAFVGAKLAYFFAEAWLYDGPGAWRYWLVGKSVTGALLGGYVGVELSKKLVGYRSATGDRFALVVPLGMVIGRLGCLSHGCCSGVVMEGGWRWPSVPVEMGFNVVAWVVLFLVRRRVWARGQLFHFYLMGYGLFRFWHEFFRVTPKVMLGLSGYQWIAVGIFGLGVWGWWRRRD